MFTGRLFQVNVPIKHCLTQWISKLPGSWAKQYLVNFTGLLGKVNATVHYSGVIIGAIASQITSVSIAYSTVCSEGDQRKHQSYASLAFVRGIYLWPVDSPHKGLVARKLFPFDDVIMFTKPSQFLQASSMTNCPNFKHFVLSGLSRHFQPWLPCVHALSPFSGRLFHSTILLHGCIFYIPLHYIQCGVRCQICRKCMKNVNEIDSTNDWKIRCYRRNHRTDPISTTQPCEIWVKRPVRIFLDVYFIRIINHYRKLYKLYKKTTNFSANMSTVSRVHTLQCFYSNHHE